MNKRRFAIFAIFMMVLTSFITGCSGSDILMDENGEEVSFENQNEPVLIYMFTGVG